MQQGKPFPHHLDVSVYVLLPYPAHGSVCFTYCVDPLHQISAHPDVIFYGEPQKKVFTPSGGHADFDNGVEVTVPANAVSAGTSVGIKVQPSLASRDVFLMPEGIQSASPSYLISGEGLNGEVTLSMEHHVRVSTQEEADDLLFLQADSYPKRSGSKSVYEYQRVQEGRSEFTLGGNTGRLTRCLSKKQFFKVGHQARVGGECIKKCACSVSGMLLLQAGMLPASLMTPQNLRVLTSILSEFTSLLHRQLGTE